MVLFVAELRTTSGSIYGFEVAGVGQDSPFWGYEEGESTSEGPSQICILTRASFVVTEEGSSSQEPSSSCSSLTPAPCSPGSSFSASVSARPGFDVFGSQPYSRIHRCAS